MLKAQGAWGEIVHDLKLRQEIIRQRGRKRLSAALSRDFLHVFVERKLADAKHSRRAASELAHVLQSLAAAPTSLSTPPRQHEEPAIKYTERAATRIEPERLRIGTGYAGNR